MFIYFSHFFFYFFVCDEEVDVIVCDASKTFRIKEGVRYNNFIIRVHFEVVHKLRDAKNTLPLFS